MFALLRQMEEGNRVAFGTALWLTVSFLLLALEIVYIKVAPIGWAVASASELGRCFAGFSVVDECLPPDMCWLLWAEGWSGEEGAGILLVSLQDGNGGDCLPKAFSQISCWLRLIDCIHVTCTLLCSDPCMADWCTEKSVFPEMSIGIASTRHRESQKLSFYVPPKYHSAHCQNQALLTLLGFHSSVFAIKILVRSASSRHTEQIPDLVFFALIKAHAPGRGRQTGMSVRFVQGALSVLQSISECT